MYLYFFVYLPGRAGNVRSNYFNCVDLTVYKHSEFKFGYSSLHLLFDSINSIWY